MLKYIIRLGVCVPLILFGILFSLAALSILALSDGTISAIMFGFFALACFFGVYRYWNPPTPRKRTKPSKPNRVPLLPSDRTAKDILMREVNNIIRQHIHTLALEQNRKIVTDKYGVVDASAWKKEQEHFSSHVALPHIQRALSASQLARAQRWLARQSGVRAGESSGSLLVTQLVMRAIDVEVESQLERSAKKSPTSIVDMNPYEFEEWCASELSDNGWNAMTVGGAGDQGADITAQRNGKTAVVQCKKYAQPVGNSAVQQVHAARTFYRAHFAAVVATSGYTPSARALAQQTGVHLLLPDELATFDPDSLA